MATHLEEGESSRTSKSSRTRKVVVGLVGVVVGGLVVGFVVGSVVGSVVGTGSQTQSPTSDELLM